MPNWVIIDDATGRVKEIILSSPHDPDYPVNPGETAIKDTDLSMTKGVPNKYLKFDKGVVVEMDKAEKDAVIAEEDAAKKTVDDLRVSVKAKLTGLGFTDEESGFILRQS